MLDLKHCHQSSNLSLHLKWMQERSNHKLDKFIRSPLKETMMLCCSYAPFKQHSWAEAEESGDANTNSIIKWPLFCQIFLNLLQYTTLLEAIMWNLCTGISMFPCHTPYQICNTTFTVPTCVALDEKHVKWKHKIRYINSPQCSSIASSKRQQDKSYHLEDYSSSTCFKIDQQKQQPKFSHQCFLSAIFRI